MREKLLKIQTEFIYAAMTGAMRLPDHVLAATMKTIKDIARAMPENPKDGGEMMMRLAEMEEFFRIGPPDSDSLRKIIFDARPSQIKSVIRGYLINYVYDW